ncbi:1-acyl-sn-glycerol-3-phosphate acyltransferase [Patescibacteria group bacterium]|nr:1-acyl-sn-glycerol-3-phosphate acyltransferase [Patescibacteria group bacterium]
MAKKEKTLLYKFLIFITKIVFTPTSKIYGLKNIPKKEVFIIVANHGSIFDPLVITCALYNFIHRYLLPKRKFYWIGNARLRERFYLKFLCEDGGYLASNSMVVLKSLKLLKKENPIGIFPEGARIHSKNIGDGKNGIAYMALLSGACVVPTACFGPKAQGFFRGLIALFLPKKIVFGKPIYFEKMDSSKIKKGQDIIRLTTSKIMQEIIKLHNL